METLEFIIHPDGRVEETVTGIVGASCTEVTAAIEASLGRVLDRELTADHFAEQTVTEGAAIAANQTYGQWS
ncbi:MAG: DUF2997 domain-containing protein [Cyanophyceae cyanobacterium]|jgi:hypothetical protein